MIFLRQYDRSIRVGFPAYLLTLPPLLIGALMIGVLYVAVDIYIFDNYDHAYGQGVSLWLSFLVWTGFVVLLGLLPAYIISLLLMPAVAIGYSHRLLTAAFVVGLLVGAIPNPA